MSGSVYVKMHPLIRRAFAGKRIEARRCVPDVPECYLVGLAAGCKENALSRRVELKLGHGSKVRWNHYPR